MSKENNGPWWRLDQQGLALLPMFVGLQVCSMWKPTLLSAVWVELALVID